MYEHNNSNVILMNKRYKLFLLTIIVFNNMIVFSSIYTYLNTIIKRGICVIATINVIKNNSIKNGYMVRHDVLQGPAVATGTTVTSAYPGSN